VALKSLGGSGRVNGYAFVVNTTEEWSEFKSRILSVEWNKLDGIFETNMSSISGFYEQKMANK